MAACGGYHRRGSADRIHLRETDEKTDHDQGFQCRSHRSAPGIKSAAHTAALDGGTGLRVRDFGSEAAVRRIGTELHEPGAGCKVFPSDLLYRPDDLFCI